MVGREVRIRGEDFQKSYLDLDINVLEFPIRAVQGWEKRKETKLYKTIYLQKKRSKVRMGEKKFESHQLP